MAVVPSADTGPYTPAVDACGTNVSVFCDVLVIEAVLAVVALLAVLTVVPLLAVGYVRMV